VITEYVATHLGGDRARWDALTDEDRASVLGYAIARRNKEGSDASMGAVTPRDLVRLVNEMHGAKKAAAGEDVVGAYLGGG
jgi:hypothetical protein